MKFLSLSIVVLLSSTVFANEIINCRSSQTGFNYIFNTCSNSVKILKDGRQIKSSEGLKFVAGTGEDIVYTINDFEGNQVGIISGEEGLRGTFLHSMFESNLNDRKLTCTKRAARTRVSPTGVITGAGAPLPVICLE